MTDPASKGSYVSGALTAIASFLTLNQWALLIGILATIVTAAVNVWSRVQNVRSQREMERDQRDHHHKMRQIHRDDQDDPHD